MIAVVARVARVAARRLRNAARDDEGSALVEFVVLAVLMLVPIVYLIVALGRIQAGALAVEQAAREGGRAFVTSPDERSAPTRARAAATLAYGDQGFAAPSRGQVGVSCSADPCLSPDARVIVTTRLVVELPGLPRILAGAIPMAVTVSADHISTVGAYEDVGGAP